MEELISKQNWSQIIFIYVLFFLSFLCLWKIVFVLRR